MRRIPDRWIKVLPDGLAALFLFGLNAWIAWRLFWVEYTPNFGSIEGSFIGLARYISRHWDSFFWWPNGHCNAPDRHSRFGRCATETDLPRIRAVRSGHRGRVPHQHPGEHGARPRDFLLAVRATSGPAGSRVEDRGRRGGAGVRNRVQR